MSGVLISMKVNGRQVTGMLDSGAQLSVLDRVSFVNMEIGYQQSYGQVQGLDSNPVEVCGGATVIIDVGDGQRVSQKLQVLASDYPILITRFFYENSIYHIRLGDIWKETKANTREGQPFLERQ